MGHVRRLALLAAMLAAACGSEREAAGFTVTDSAGVRIVTNAGPAWDPAGAWRISDAPLMHVGGSADTALRLRHVDGALRLADGRIVVADGRALTLYFLSPEGALQSTAGQGGSAPGEFRGIRSIFLAGDSIAVVDPALERVSLFDPAGGFGRASRLEKVDRGVFPAVPIGRLADGRFIAVASLPISSQDPSGRRRDSSRVFLMSADGVPEERLMTLPDDEKLIFVTARFVSSSRMPFGRETTIRLRNGRLWTATADGYRLDEWSTGDGRLIGSVRWTRPPVPVAPDAVKALRDSMRTSRDQERTQLRELLDVMAKVYEETEFPAAEPPYGTFLVDAAGRLWVKDYLPPHDAVSPSTWQVFDAEGRLLGAVGMPPGFAPTDIGDDYVLGTWLDDDGLPHVVMYGIIRAASPSAQAR